MCCAFLLLLSGAPRLAVAWLWLFTDRMSIAFDSWVLPTLGFFVLPWTTLFWALAYAPFDGVSGFGIIVVIFGVFLDISSYGGGGKYRYDAQGAAA